jgi:anti-sigma-K factor RskA
MTDIHTLAGAYALDAVTDLERVAFDRHVAQCEACAHEVAELRATAARLADDTAQTPPDRLREDVFEEIRRTRQVGPSTRSSGAPAPRWRRWAVAAAVVGLVAAGGVAVGYAVQDQRVRDAQRQATGARRVEMVLSAPDAQVRTAPGPGDGHVTVVTSASLNAGVAFVNRVTPPGPDRAYEFWLIRDAHPTRAAVMATDTGHATVLFDGVRGVQSLGMTDEPAGGSEQPTTPVLVTIPLT